MLKKRTLILLILSGFMLKVAAQTPLDYDLQKSLNTIIEAEQRHHQSLETFEASGAGANFDIFYHRFEWRVNPAYRYISGAVTTYFKAVDNMNTMTFDIDNALKVDSVKQRGAKLLFSQLPDKTMQINLPQQVNKGGVDSITVYYQGEPIKTGFGSFNQRLRGGTKPEIWTLSEPYGSRDWFPGKSDLVDKIDSIDVIVQCPPQYRVASNGLLIRELAVNDTSKLFHWKHRYPIVNYLVAFAVTDYVQYIDKAKLSRGDSMNILNYVYPESLAVSQAGSFKTANATRLFDSLFVEYPFKKEKYGHAQCGFGGGQEHQTMSFMGNVTDAGLIAHELAHQWFGDKITCGSWQDIWLNEGFATYLTGLYFQYVEPFFWRNWRVAVLGGATSGTSGSVFVDDTTSVSRIFNSSLSYNKGAYVLHNLRFKLGDSAFFAGIRRYQNDPSVIYGFARTTDIKRNLEAVSGQNLTEFFNDYIYGQGYPSFTVTSLQTDFTGRVQVMIKQTQSHPSVSFFETPVPVKLISKQTGKDTTFVFNLTQNNQAFAANFSPTIGSIDSVVFDPELRLLSKNNIVKVLVTGVTQEIDNQWISQITPNPTKDNITVNFKSDKTEPLSIEVINEVGQIILKNNFTSHYGDNSKTLYLSDLPTGFYVLKLTTASKIGIQKFIKN
ncbi:MAG: M1 family aminopeptidase [Saprospiraceae bacterium]|nr:M1 family aminopeptidase [Saprospiraceae bacterium]